jgi:uncharacterized protein (DUF433 family)
LVVKKAANREGKNKKGGLDKDQASTTGSGSSEGSVKAKRGRNMEIFPGISMDPRIRFGKSCLAGTRIDAATIVGALAGGESYEDVEKAYGITREQILAALRFTRHMSLRTFLPPSRKSRENPPR